MNISKQDTGFRASIGDFINNISDQNQTILLEPAGIIPYYAKCKVVDVVGLTSSKIINYHISNKNDWWLTFIKEESPDFILDRGAVHNGLSIDGAKSLSNKELSWFLNNYVLVRSFVYDEYLNASHSIFTPFYRLGSSTNYYLYRKRFH